MQADGRQLQLTFKCAAVERFNIDQFVLETQGTGVDFVVGQRVKHERVVRVRAMPYSNALRREIQAKAPKSD